MLEFLMQVALEASDKAKVQALESIQQLQQQLSVEAGCHKALQGRHAELSKGRSELGAQVEQQKASMSALKRNLDACQRSLTQKEDHVKQEATRADAAVGNATRLQASHVRKMAISTSCADAAYRSGNRLYLASSYHCLEDCIFSKAQCIRHLH